MSALDVESDEPAYDLEGGMIHCIASCHYVALCHCVSFHYASFHYASFHYALFHCALLWNAEVSHGTTIQRHEGSHEYEY